MHTLDAIHIINFIWPNWSMKVKQAHNNDMESVQITLDKLVPRTEEKQTNSFPK